MTSPSILDTVEIVSPKDSSKKLVINRTQYDPDKHMLWEEKDFMPAAEVTEETPKKRRGRPPKAKAEETAEEEKPSEELLTDADDPGPIWEYKSDG